MQTQAADALCLQLRVGQVSMVSMPADYLPKRIDWAKWVDGVAMTARVKKNKSTSQPRICMSPDHLDAKDNLAFFSMQSQNGLEHVDPLKIMADVAEETKILFVGSWNQPSPSWFKSVQSVFAARYAGFAAEVLPRQLKLWSPAAERMENRGCFLVTDDLGRISALSSIGRSWRSRQTRAAMTSETRNPSWFAAAFDVHLGVSSEGVGLRLHRLAVLEPESWCGAPKIQEEHLSNLSLGKGCPEVWISTPGLGMSLWLADQLEPLSTLQPRLRMPSAVLGWHPLRDLVSFVAEAPSGSVIYLVDANARLQLLKKELDGAS